MGLQLFELFHGVAVAGVQLKRLLVVLGGEVFFSMVQLGLGEAVVGVVGIEQCRRSIAGKGKNRRAWGCGRSA
jgi:hypothetical protein